MGREREPEQGSALMGGQAGGGGVGRGGAGEVAEVSSIGDGPARYWGVSGTEKWRDQRQSTWARKSDWGGG